MTEFIGIDPGTYRTGWAVITTKNGKLEIVEGGVVVVHRNMSLLDRLKTIETRLETILTYWPQSYVGIEEPFVGKNPKSAISIAKVHAVCLLTASRITKTTSRIYTYTPGQVKKAVGKGNATKAEVQRLVAAIYGFHVTLPEDESDAVAVATCLEQDIRFNARLEGGDV